MDERNLLIVANGVPGKVSFDNFAEVKRYLEAGLADFSGLVYTEADIASAESDRKTLKSVKKKLEDKKKEIKAAYSKPYVEVEAKIDELIGMVKEPLDIVERFIRETEKTIKLQEVKAYAGERAKSLGDYSEKVLNSPSFFNERWLNATYKTKDWHADIDTIIAKACGKKQR